MKKTTNNKERPTEGYGLEYQINALIQYARSGISNLDIEQQGQYFNRIDRFGGDIKEALLCRPKISQEDIRYFIQEMETLITSRSGENSEQWNLEKSYLLWLFEKLGIGVTS
jgi:hypothetical protein